MSNPLLTNDAALMVLDRMWGNGTHRNVMMRRLAPLIERPLTEHDIWEAAHRPRGEAVVTKEASKAIDDAMRGWMPEVAMTQAWAVPFGSAVNRPPDNKTVKVAPGTHKVPKGGYVMFRREIAKP